MTSLSKGYARSNHNTAAMSSEDDRGGDERRRAPAKCDTCGAIYTVRTDLDGNVHPIGTSDDSGCTCGDGKLEIISL